ncbi:MAG: circularly permuted type 2 ATP-grasp protein, partial [Rhodopseudomonas palustris]|nr:circularly permuted type 2 ATP-grasp protein [Rhodopseudomonas palustris]
RRRVDPARRPDAGADGLYGPNRLVQQGVLPPALVAGNPEWLRPMVGIAPRGGHHLHFLAFEVGRGPDGDRWVLGDRAQAPSGAGFALENRVATSRVFSDFYAEAHVHRLAGLLPHLPRCAAGASGRSAGPRGHPYAGPAERDLLRARLDRTLSGLHAAAGRGSDGGERSPDGPHRWRAAAGQRALAPARQPLCRSAGTGGRLHIGTPGLVSALRHGSTTLVNALGSVCSRHGPSSPSCRASPGRALLGEELQLPNIATWWCGRAAERAHVAAHAERMIISPALSTWQPVEDELSALAEKQPAALDLDDHGPRGRGTGRAGIGGAGPYHAAMIGGEIWCPGR